MLNSLWLLFENNKLKRASFEPLENSLEVNVLELLIALDHQYKVQMGTDWLAISPKGYTAPIPTNSVDWWDPESG